MRFERISVSRLAALLVTGLLLGCAPKPRPLERPTGPLGLEAAREYLLAIVNRDREAEGLAAVELDEVASRAGQIHAEDMARNGFTAHWGSDGSVPEQRYTDAGGVHLVHENAACFFDGKKRELDIGATFSAESLERIEHAFISEVPPADGHRRNILNPRHRRVGFGVARPAGLDQPCLTQEFVDDYGDYEEVPGKARRGARVTIAGELEEPATFGGVGIAHGPLPKPMPAAELNATSTYAMPTPYATFFPPGFVSPRPVQMDGKRFAIELPLDRGPGRYSVSVWGRFPDGGNELAMTSLRTILVR